MGDNCAPAGQAVGDLDKLLATARATMARRQMQLSP
jgi:hypothetical protein